METADYSERKKIVLNPMQLMLEIAPQRVRVVQVGRGGGKSTGAAIDMKNVLYDMPRSKNFVLAETYQQALTRTLPSTIKSLGNLGFKKDLHFFVGRLPPPSWKWQQCYEPPLDPKHSIFFYNGTVWDLLSQDTNSRGGNYASGLVDEAQDIDQGKFESEAVPTMRLEYERFKNKKTYRRLSLYCSMPRTRKAEWIFQYQDLAKKFPKDHLWISGPSMINSANLPPEWFSDQKRILLPSEYDIEILNIRPRKVMGGFYPLFDDKRCSYSKFNNEYLEGLIDAKFGYSSESFENLTSLQDEDVDFDQPLEIAMDYGASFNGIVTGQEQGNEFFFLSGMDIGSGERFEDLLIKWCMYYRFHRNKTVYYWYDHTAKDRDSRTEEYPIIVSRVLRSYGWNVIDMYIGQQPGHDERYRFWGYAHKGDHPDLPRFWYNSHHCKYLIISLNNANVIQGRNGFEKDKKDEKNHKIDQRTTTHYSDAHDTLAFGKYAANLSGRAPLPRARMSKR